MIDQVPWAQVNAYSEYAPSLRGKFFYKCPGWKRLFLQS